ncbi:mRNA export factor GLE1-like [Saccostrea cucullata]|uniref:mRNA export factor GLE1-like n=1 Tax=Saccostrea cuccullata TaxID=36930 RepID=UPI002ED33514
MKSIVSQLKASPKGQLKYERDPNIEKEYFDKYLSPPKLSTHHSEMSTQNSFYVQEEDEGESSESDISESIRNLKVQIKNKVRKPNKAKVQFTTKNHPSVSDMTIQVSNRRSDPTYADTKRNAGQIKVSFSNDLCKDNHKKKGRLTEKPLDLPSVDKAASEKFIVSPEYNRSRRGIQDYEEERIKESKTEFERKRRQFKEAGRKINRKAERQINEYENKRQEKAASQQKQMDQLEKQGSAELLEKQMKMIQGYIHHAKMVEKKQERIQEEMKKKEAERLKILEKVKSIVSDSKTILDKVKTMYNAYAAKLPESVAKGIQSAQQRYNMSQQIVSPEDSRPEITNQHIITITENFRFLSNTHDFVKQSIQEVKEKEKEALEAKVKAEEEARKKAEEEASKPAEAASSVGSPGQPLVSSTPIPGATSQETQGATGGVPVATGPTATPQISPAEGEVLCVDMEAFQEYTGLQQMLKDAEEAIQVLSSTQQLKKMKFDLQKAVNIPINAISAVSGAHLRDKLQRLLVLLSGQQVEISNKRVSVRDHPAALPFCKYLIAKMVVRKGEEQVSSIFESAFPLAAVMVGLLTQHPDIRDLLLAHFHSLCPYTVPYHIPRQDQQSTEEYHKALGYKYDSDGNVEKQDKFLKRMSGIMRLYTSIMVSSPPRQQSTHPFGIEHAWIWLSRVMNIQPLPDVTATMVFDLLEVTGHALFHKYKKQFLKMLHILIREFLPKLKSVASSGGGGPVSRLEALIKASIQRQGQIPPPEGLLPPNFWSS